MMLVPHWMWRGGAASRALVIGMLAGVFLGALVFADSGSWLAAVVAVFVLGIFYGIVMCRRMGRFWPGAADLTGAHRATVVHATRRGHDVGEDRLAPAVLGYSAGLREVHGQAQRYRWVVPLFAALAVALAVFDSFTGPVRAAVLSWLVVGFFVVEMLWWPRHQDHLLSNAERAERLALQRRW
jgi:hypothetical protein